MFWTGGNIWKNKERHNRSFYSIGESTFVVYIEAIIDDMMEGYAYLLVDMEVYTDYVMEKHIISIDYMPED